MAMDEPSRTVLLIENNPISTLWIRDMMATTPDAQWQLEWADRPDIGLGYLGQHSVDAVLLDLSMPGRRGLEVLHQVRTRAPAVPIVVLANPSDDAITRQAVQLGVQECLSKRELDGHVLVRSLRYAVERKQLEERLRLLAERSADIIFRYRLAPTPGLEYVSPAVIAITGYTPEEFLADPDLPFKIVDPRDRSLLTGAGYDLVVAPCTPHSARWRRKDGRVVWTEETLIPVYDCRGDLVAVEGIARDVTARKEAEEKLRASEEQFRLLMQGVRDDAIYMLDPEGRIVSWNAGAERIKGYRQAEIIGQHVSCFYPPEDVARGTPAQSLAKALLHGRFEEEGWRVRQDGSRFWASVVTTALRDEAGNLRGFAKVTRDLTARKRAEEAMRASEALFRAIFDQAPVGIALIGPDGRLIRTNRSLQHTLGYSDEELRQLPIQKLVPPDDGAIGADLLAELLAGKRSGYHVERRYVRKDGATIWASASMSRIQDLGEGAPWAIGMLQDVTERKQTEEVVRRNERHFRLLVESAADVVTVIDAVGTTSYVSPSVERVLGYTPDDVRGRSAFAFVHPDDRERVRDAFLRLLHNPDGGPRVEFRCQHRDGSWRILEALGANLVDDPDVAGIGVTLRDVTERKSLEEQLRRAQKLEAIGRLADGVAHDFRNVVGAIKGFSELLRERLPSTDTRQEILTEITNAGDMAETLTERLLAVSHQQTVPPTTLNLNTVVRRLEVLLRLVVGDAIGLVTDLTSDSTLITTDPGQAEQALINLASNARDAMPQGGTLTITTAAVYLEAGFAQSHRLITSKPYVRLTVRDNGVGMDAVTREHIFEPFFTTKKDGQGFGLGLATVYGFVKQSGGTIDIESTPGQGTAVTIYLPQAGEPVDGLTTADDLHSTTRIVDGRP